MNRKQRFAEDLIRAVFEELVLVKFVSTVFVYSFCKNIRNNSKKLHKRDPSCFPSHTGGRSMGTNDTDTANDALMSDDVSQHFVKIQGSHHSAAANI